LSLTFETEVHDGDGCEICEFQSSFFEFDLWNERNTRTGKELYRDFNPHFLSLTFETYSDRVGSTTTCNFNPHFLSLTFETVYILPILLYIRWISILIFWVWPLKHVVHCNVAFHVFLFQSSFFEFDLWNSFSVLDNPICYLFQSSFFEFDLWNIVNITWTRIQLDAFQSSFFEFDLWNKRWYILDMGAPYISILIFWVWPLKLV